MITQMLTIGVSIAMLFLAGIASQPQHQASADTVKCEDIKGKMKWQDQPSQHNNPSEKKFKQLVFEEDALPCEISKCYDHNKCEGTIKSSKWGEFKETAAYLGTTEDVQKCFDKRYNLPDDGKKALQAYEYHHCQIGSY